MITCCRESGREVAPSRNGRIGAGETAVIRIEGGCANDPQIMRSLGVQIDFLYRTMGLRVVIVQGAYTGYEESARRLNGRMAAEVGQACRGNIVPLPLAAYERGLVDISPLKDMASPIVPSDLIISKEKFQSLFREPEQSYLPIFSPFCARADIEGAIGVDPDILAMAIARDMAACRLVLCGSAKGIVDKNGTMISSIKNDDIGKLLMSSCLRPDSHFLLSVANRALDEMCGCGAVAVLDPRYPDALASEFSPNRGGGTLISRSSCAVKTKNRNVTLVPAYKTRRSTAA